MVDSSLHAVVRPRRRVRIRAQVYKYVYARVCGYASKGFNAIWRPPSYHPVIFRAPAARYIGTRARTLFCTLVRASHVRVSGGEKCINRYQARRWRRSDEKRRNNNNYHRRHAAGRSRRRFVFTRSPPSVSFCPPRIRRSPVRTNSNAHFATYSSRRGPGRKPTGRPCSKYVRNLRYQTPTFVYPSDIIILYVVYDGCIASLWHHCPISNTFASQDVPIMSSSRTDP